jgi:diacylglycerol kinase family enzyme
MSAVPLSAGPALRRTIARPAAATRDVVLLANANASGLARQPHALELARSAMRERGARVEIQRTASLQELEATWPELAGRRVVLVGGDGTLHAAANLAGPQPELAILPAGRANNVARSLGVPLDLGAAARLAVDGKARSLDVIAAETAGATYYAVEGVSVGIHARARALYDAPNSADTWAGIRSAVAGVRGFDGMTISVSSDGSCELLSIGQLFVANFPRYGPGLQVAPAARPDDGVLDLVTLGWTGGASLLPMLARLRRGTHLRRPGTRSWTARKVRIATRGASPIIADTTVLGTGPVTLTVVPSALAVVAP